jgi:hypothetical protein
MNLDTIHFRGTIKRVVETFSGTVRRAGFTPLRELLARLRVFDPVVAARRAGGRKCLTLAVLTELGRLGYKRERLIAS